jgi:hypothetical protein
MDKQSLITECLSIVNKVPLDGRGRRSWQHAPDLAGKIAALVIKHGPAAGFEIDRSAASMGVGRGPLRHFIHGRTTGGAKWPAIVGVMQREGVEPLAGRYAAESARIERTVQTATSTKDTVHPGARPIMMWQDDDGNTHVPDPIGFTNDEYKSITGASGFAFPTMGDLIKAQREHIASAMSVPKDIMLGTQPGGLTASAMGEAESYIAMCRRMAGMEP